MAQLSGAAARDTEVVGAGEWHSGRGRTARGNGPVTLVGEDAFGCAVEGRRVTVGV